MLQNVPSPPPPVVRPPAAPELLVASSNGELRTLVRTDSSPNWASSFTGPAWKMLACVGGLVLVTVGIGYAIKDDNSLPLEITASVIRAELPITVTETGELESSETVEVRCEVEGEQNRITEAIPEGTRVTKGQVIIRFDTDKLGRSAVEQEVKWRTALAKAQAAEEDLEVARNKSESEIGKADLTLRIARLDLRKYEQGDYPQEKLTIEGEIVVAQVNEKRAQDVLNHSQRMFRKGYVSNSELEANRSTVTNAQNTVKIAKEKLRVLNEFTREKQVADLTGKADEAARELERTKRSQASAVSKAQTDFQAARDTAAIEKSVKDKLEQQLERCTVLAPQDGILVYDKSRPWDTTGRIQPGGVVHYQRQLFSLPNLNKMQVKVKIHESAINKVRVGQRAELRVDAFASTVLHGVVERVATLAENRGYWDQRGVKEYETIVKVVDLPENSGLRPGMTAEVKILVNHLRDVLVVPIQAVAEKDGEHLSFVVNGPSIERRQVLIGENNEKFVEIKGGLLEGERLALDAPARLGAESDKLKPDDATPPKSEPPRTTAAVNNTNPTKRP